MNTAGHNHAYAQSTSLFPPLEDSQSPQVKDEEGDLLWSNVKTFAIPDDTLPETSHHHSGFAKELLSKGLASSSSCSSSSAFKGTLPDESKSDAFTISWGDDRSPLDRDEREPTAIKLTRPLPKPRGIRKLPEPEPSEDGTVDEDTLKRRKNTDAARRSRLKKLMKVDQLENQVNALQAENAKLVLNNAVLESEKKSLHAKEAEYKKRIKYLEDIMILQGWDFENNYHVSSDQW